jgi:hypothetical protein
MENTPNNDDEQWFSALAGRANPNGDARSNLQAQALRRALLARAEVLETKVPFADEDQFQKLLLRLQREKLLAPKTGWRTSPNWVKATGVLGLSADVILWKSPMVWGLTATLVIGVAMVMNGQNAVKTRGEADILRGGNVTTQIVADPEIRLAELLRDLRAAGVEPVVERINNGAIVLTMNVSPKVLDYLDTQRIVPTVVDGKTSLLLMRPKATSKPK